MYIKYLVKYTASTERPECAPLPISTEQHKHIQIYVLKLKNGFKRNPT
jgi:hypothetical protein